MLGRQPRVLRTPNSVYTFDTIPANIMNELPRIEKATASC